MFYQDKERKNLYYKDSQVGMIHVAIKKNGQDVLVRYPSNRNIKDLEPVNMADSTWCKVGYGKAMNIISFYIKKDGNDLPEFASSSFIKSNSEYDNPAGGSIINFDRYNKLIDYIEEKIRFLMDYFEERLDHFEILFVSNGSKKKQKDIESELKAVGDMIGKRKSGRDKLEAYVKDLQNCYHALNESATMKESDWGYVDPNVDPLNCEIPFYYNFVNFPDFKSFEPKFTLCVSKDKKDNKKIEDLTPVGLAEANEDLLSHELKLKINDTGSLDDVGYQEYYNPKIWPDNLMYRLLKSGETFESDHGNKVEPPWKKLCKYPDIAFFTRVKVQDCDDIVYKLKRISNNLVDKALKSIDTYMSGNTVYAVVPWGNVYAFDLKVNSKAKVVSGVHPRAYMIDKSYVRYVFPVDLMYKVLMYESIFVCNLAVFGHGVIIGSLYYGFLYSKSYPVWHEISKKLFKYRFYKTFLVIDDDNKLKFGYFDKGVAHLTDNDIHTIKQNDVIDNISNIIHRTKKMENPEESPFDDYLDDLEASINDLVESCGLSAHDARQAIEKAIYSLGVPSSKALSNLLSLGVNMKKIQDNSYRLGQDYLMHGYKCFGIPSKWCNLINEHLFDRFGISKSIVQEGWNEAKEVNQDNIVRVQETFEYDKIVNNSNDNEVNGMKEVPSSAIIEKEISLVYDRILNDHGDTIYVPLPSELMPKIDVIISFHRVMSRRPRNFFFLAINYEGMLRPYYINDSFTVQLVADYLPTYKAMNELVNVLKNTASIIFELKDLTSS